MLPAQPAVDRARRRVEGSLSTAPRGNGRQRGRTVRYARSCHAAEPAYDGWCWWQGDVHGRWSIHRHRSVQHPRSVGAGQQTFEDAIPRSVPGQTPARSRRSARDRTPRACPARQCRIGSDTQFSPPSSGHERTAGFVDRSGPVEGQRWTRIEYPRAYELESPEHAWRREVSRSAPSRGEAVVCRQGGPAPGGVVHRIVECVGCSNDCRVR